MWACFRIKSRLVYVWKWTLKRIYSPYKPPDRNKLFATCQIHFKFECFKVWITLYVTFSLTHLIQALSLGRLLTILSGFISYKSALPLNLFYEFSWFFYSWVMEIVYILSLHILGIHKNESTIIFHTHN